jgi:glycosidase
VWLSGAWLGWPPSPAEGALELARDGEGWSVTTRIDATGRHEYKLILDGGQWIADPANPERTPDGFGGDNSVLHVCEDAGSSCAPGFDWRDAVMYFALVDRFRDSDGLASPVDGATDGDAWAGASAQYEGGDLAGVRERMSYLADLGVSALWLSAPVDNRDAAGAATDPASDPHLYSGYHGYWPSPDDIDYSDPQAPSPRPRVEPRLGSEDDLRGVVTDAHERGIRVVFDYVMHHVDVDSGLYRAHPEWFSRDGDSFRICNSSCGAGSCWDDPYWTTRCAFTSYLPTFDFEGHADALEWSVADAVYWATELGIDGYRLDAVKHVPTAWLERLRSELAERIPDPDGGRFYLVGETFTYDDRDLIGRFVAPGTMLDGQFDFPLRARLCEAVFTEAGSLQSLSQWLDGNDGLYGPDAIMATWIGNHDVPRAIHFASREIGDCRQGSSPDNGWSGRYAQPGDAAPYERLGVAFALLFTSPGVPLIYYGDEIGLAGGGDPDNRRMMPVDDASLGAPQIALRDRVRALARLRASHPVLGRGRRETIAVDRDTWVFRRTGCGDGGDVVVALNRADAAHDVTLPAGAWTDLVTGQPVDGGGSWSLPARSFLVLGTR